MIPHGLVSGSQVNMQAVGHHDDALPLSERAIEVAPVELFYRANYALLFFLARDYERSVEEFLKLLEIDPDYSYAVLAVVLVYEQLGREEDAHRTWKWALRLLGRDEEWLRGWERAYQEAGFGGARRYYLAWATERAKTKYVDPLSTAREYATLGEVDAAFEWLERAYQERNSQLVYLGILPTWDPLRSDPRFDDLLRRINYPGAS